MTQKRTVKIIKGTGPGLSTKQLEEVSMRLLLSRIRGSEPQISFTFVQRLLDELILRRHDDMKLDSELDELLQSEDATTSLLVSDDDEWLHGSDDLMLPEDNLEVTKEWVASDSFDLRTLEYSDLEMVPEAHEEVKEDYEEDEEDYLGDTEVYTEPVKSKRPPVLACSKKRSAWSAVNPFRVLAISILVVLVLACGVLLSGCNHQHQDQAVPYGTDSVDGIFFVYKDIEGNTVEPALARRGRLLSSAMISINAFKKDHDGKLPSVWICEVYIGPTVETNPDYVPCGIPNGGGCFTYASQRMMLAAGPCDDLTYLYHELNHARLEDAGSDRVKNNAHQGDSWLLSAQRVYEIQKEFCPEKR